MKLTMDDAKALEERAHDAHRRAARDDVAAPGAVPESEHQHLRSSARRRTTSRCASTSSQAGRMFIARRGRGTPARRRARTDRARDARHQLARGDHRRAGAHPRHPVHRRSACSSRRARRRRSATRTIRSSFRSTRARFRLFGTDRLRSISVLAQSRGQDPRRDGRHPARAAPRASARRRASRTTSRSAIRPTSSTPSARRRRSSPTCCAASPPCRCSSAASAS